MTHKRFQELARLLWDAKLAVSQSLHSAAHIAGGFEAISDIEWRLKSYLASQNPRFDPERFSNAARGIADVDT